MGGERKHSRCCRRFPRRRLGRHRTDDNWKPRVQIGFVFDQSRVESRSFNKWSLSCHSWVFITSRMPESAV